jgi:homoserine dehydrogenase
MTPKIKTYNLCFLGFGNVNRTLVRLLSEREKELRDGYGIRWRITGVASRTLGQIADRKGLAIGIIERTSSASTGPHSAASAASPKSHSSAAIARWVARAKAEVLFEATSLNVADGQPAIDYLSAALRRGVHAITANKGPVVYGYRKLSKLAAAKQKRFLFESAVMDGAPIFSLFRDSLPAVHLRGFRGILNSTTNVILSGMERGQSFEEALGRAQAIGVAETDASHDIDGWDACMKVAALVNVLMGVPLRPEQVERQGIRGISPEAMRRARAQGKCYKLICRAERKGRSVEASVRPELLPLSDPLAQVSGTSSIIHFETDIFPGLVITEHDPGLEATAYGMLSDFVRAVSR